MLLSQRQQEQLREFKDQIVALHDQRRQIGSEISILLKRAKGVGIDKKAFQKAISIIQEGTGARASMDLGQLYLSYLEQPDMFADAEARFEQQLVERGEMPPGRGEPPEPGDNVEPLRRRGRPHKGTAKEPQAAARSRKRNGQGEMGQIFN